MRDLLNEWSEMFGKAEGTNRLLKKPVFTNFRRYDQEGVDEVTELKSVDNLLLKGDNLPILHSLLKNYKGKIKLIYIDPPYNTGNDSFVYNDKFVHAAWLTFMKNRLKVAKKLLHPEGALFIQIDDNEMAYLKVLCDEIFGRENFKECISVKNGTESGVNAINVTRGERLFKVKEHILYYAKDKSLHRFNPLFVKAVSYNQSYRFELMKNKEGYFVKDVYKDILLKLFHRDSLHGLTKEQKFLFNATFEEYCLAKSDAIYALKSDIQKSGSAFKTLAAENKRKGIVEEYQTYDGRMILVYQGAMLTPLKERIVEENGTKYYGTLVSDFWGDIGATPSMEGGVNLKAGKKPEKLLKRIINLCSEENDLVLDFFLGSGTTAATALKMKRRFIGIELNDYGDNDSLVRLQNVIAGEQSGISKDSDVTWSGGGSFISAEIKSLNETFEQELEQCKQEKDIDSLLDKVLLIGNPDSKRLKVKFDQFHARYAGLDFGEKKLLLKGLLDKYQFFLPYSAMENPQFMIDEKTKKLNHQFYRVSFKKE